MFFITLGGPQAHDSSVENISKPTQTSYPIAVFNRYIVCGRKLERNAAPKPPGRNQTMGKPTPLRWTLIPLTVALAVIALHKTHPVQADQAPPPTQKTLKLGEAKPGTLYAMTVAVKDPAKLQGAD